MSKPNHFGRDMEGLKVSRSKRMKNNLQKSLDLTGEDQNLSEKKKRKQSGEASSSAILSSHQTDNSELFPKLLQLFVPDGAKIADVTFGTGVFWKNVDTSKYDFHASDLKTGVDARALPYADSELDALVFDPPYMEGLLRSHQSELAGGGTHTSFREYYSNGEGMKGTELKYHDRVIDLYMSSAKEARRVLKDRGIYIVKCQDEVSANRQKLTHVEIIYGLELLNFYCKDLFVLTRSNRPVVSRLVKQEHARKNHSYFLVFTCIKKGKLPYSNFRELLKSYS